MAWPGCPACPAARRSRQTGPAPAYRSSARIARASRSTRLSVGAVVCRRPPSLSVKRSRSWSSASVICSLPPPARRISLASSADAVSSSRPFGLQARSTWLTRDCQSSSANSRGLVQPDEYVPAFDCAASWPFFCSVCCSPDLLEPCRRSPGMVDQRIDLALVGPPEHVGGPVVDPPPVVLLVLAAFPLDLARPW